MLAALASFVLSGGLLALVQAVLSYLDKQNAATQGANSNAATVNSAVAVEATKARAIDNSVAIAPPGDALSELRKGYSRD